MSFISVLIQYKWTILFYLVIILLVYLNRKKFDIQSKIVALYKTKFGLKFIDKFVKGKEEFIKILGLCGIGIGYIGMVAIFVLMFNILYEAIKTPTVFKASPVIPGVPVAGLGVTFPLVIGWISLLIIMIIHEFSHGIMAKAHKLKINSTGIAFFGPLLGAFVDIDEKNLRKQPDHVQYSILAAGPNSNIITSILFFLLLSFLIVPTIGGMVTPVGVEIGVNEGLPAELAGLKQGDVIIGYDDNNIKTIGDFLVVEQPNPNEMHVFHTKDGRSIEVVTRPHPDNESLGQFGIDLSQATELKNDSGANKLWYGVLNWIKELLFWLFLIGFNIGLINFLPIYITDGARMLQISLNKMIKDEVKAKKVWLFFNKLSILILLLLFIIPIVMNIFNGLRGLV